MLDIRYIRENSEKVQTAADQKGYKVSVAKVIELDNSRRELQQKVDELRAKRNEVAARMKGGRPLPEQIEEGRRIKEELVGLEERLRAVTDDYTVQIKMIPNLPADDVPVGASEDENIVAKVVGQQPTFSFVPKNHAEIAEAKGWLDKTRASQVAGSRFAYVKGDLVKLQFALMQFVVDQLTDEAVLKAISEQAGLNVSTRPFEPILPPYMIRTELYDAMDRLEPRDDRYKIEGEELWLQGSAEHVLGAMHAGEIFEEANLPIRYLGYATSFRKEAGTYGKDMEGLIRMHQFDKLEMESFATAATARDEHLFFVAIQEYLLQQLGLPYRVMMKCTADIGKPNARGVDMDVWLPGQDKYRETHTADYMTDYQARRLQTRVRRKDGELELVHTNDATAFALGRTMVAIIENYQQADGSVAVPSVLQPYLGSRQTL